MPAWILHNPIADLPGPSFLGIYVAAMLATIVGIVRSIRGADRTSTDELPEVPKDPDPYAVAYLRGGVHQVLRAATFALTNEGLLAVSDQHDSRGHVVRRWISKTGQMEPDYLHPIESEVLGALPPEVSPRDLLLTGRARQAAERGCEPLKKRLAADDLLTPPECRELAPPVAALGLLILLGLGGYKLFVALAKGRTNVGFLIALMIVGAGAVIVASAASVPRLSRRGRAFLGRLQLAFAPMKKPVASPASTPAGDDLLLGVALFGLGTLVATPFSNLKTAFAAPNPSGTGCGGGCGGGGGCGSGCGGGGGGCGGGCGGGGCGGCGG